MYLLGTSNKPIRDHSEFDFIKSFRAFSRISNEYMSFLSAKKMLFYNLALLEMLSCFAASLRFLRKIFPAALLGTSSTNRIPPLSLLWELTLKFSHLIIASAVVFDLSTPCDTTI